MNRRVALGVAVTVAAALGWRQRGGNAIPPAVAMAPRSVLAPPQAVRSVFHLGHSLVGPDMPAMLAQLGGHDYRSQLGWGTTLQAHWREGEALAGYQLHASPGTAALSAREALGAPGTDVLVLTEMVEIRDALRWFDSAHWLAEWAALARQGNPGIRVYLYETWHGLDVAEGWLQRIDGDLSKYWQDRIIGPAEAGGRSGEVFVIPGGQAMAAVARAAEAGELAGLTSREDLFRRDAEGVVDPIHINNIGAYVVALTHLAVIFHRSPVGVPHQLMHGDATTTIALQPETARRVQTIVRDVVAGLPQTGVAAAGLS